MQREDAMFAQPIPIAGFPKHQDARFPVILDDAKIVYVMIVWSVWAVEFGKLAWEVSKN